MRTTLLLAVAVLAFTSCASMVIGTRPWFDEHAAGRKTLAQRAAFDLGCKPEQVEFSCIGLDSSCTTVGASGADKKATYVHTGYEWVMNSTNK